MANEKIKGGISVSTEHIFPVIKKWLYSEKEIFLREIVSNACDAITKLKRLEALGKYDGNGEAYRVDVSYNKEAKTLTVSDNGIGMNSEEVKKYICNIALSGALEFIQKYDNKSWDLEGNEIDGKVSRKLKKYDEEYFKNKSLALYYVALTSGSDTVVVSEPEIKEDTIIVKYKINTPEMGTCDMSGGLIVLEVDKSINKISGEIIL